MKKKVWASEGIDFEGRLVYLRDYISGLIEKYGESAYVEVEYDYENTDYRVKYEREETDREYTSRLKREEKEERQKKAALKKKEEKERKEFERLKKKYGDFK